MQKRSKWVRTHTKYKTLGCTNSADILSGHKCLHSESGSNNACSRGTPMATEAECQNAAAALGKTYRYAINGATQPGGCQFFSNGNTIWNTAAGRGASYISIICQEAASTPTPTPSSTPVDDGTPSPTPALTPTPTDDAHVLTTAGVSCASGAEVTSEDECRSAMTALLAADLPNKITGSQAGQFSSYSMTNRHKGCWINKNSGWTSWNSNAAGSAIGSESKGICKSI